MIDICIPTYNRASKQHRLLRALAEQNDQRYRVVVIDNASTDATQEVVTAAASMWPAGRMITHRNRINVGGNANILRCLEKAESEWAWIIGDDDIPEPGALARVAMALAENPQGLESCSRFWPWRTARDAEPERGAVAEMLGSDRL